MYTRGFIDLWESWISVFRRGKYIITFGSMAISRRHDGRDGRASQCMGLEWAKASETTKAYLEDRGAFRTIPTGANTYRRLWP